MTILMGMKVSGQSVVLMTDSLRVCDGYVVELARKLTVLPGLYCVAHAGSVDEHYAAFYGLSSGPDADLFDPWFWKARRDKERETLATNPKVEDWGAVLLIARGDTLVTVATRGEVWASDYWTAAGAGEELASYLIRKAWQPLMTQAYALELGRHVIAELAYHRPGQVGGPMQSVDTRDGIIHVD